jgi:hypothetical protein
MDILSVFLERQEMRMQILLLLLGAALAVPAQAVIYVRISGGTYNNFQDAVNAAVGTETILVGDGTYTGANNREILIDKEGINLTIESENGPDNCIINAEGLGRVFDLFNVNTADSVIIRGFTIKNGFVTGGFAFGGGINNHNSVLTVENCYILNNAAEDKGGGVYHNGSAAVAVMNNCIIADNTCTTSSGGGGMYVSNCPVTLTDCVFSKNFVLSPSMHGGGMYVTYGDLDFTNCLFEGNSTYGSGGLFFNSNSDMTFVNCTFVGNKCTANGGVGFMTGNSGWSANVAVKNCIFQGNIADGQSDNFRLIGDAVLTYSYSNLDATEIGGTGTITDAGGNIETDPLFAVDGYWKGNTWVPGDYHLKSMVGRWDPLSEIWVTDEVHSECIDAGDPADDYANEPTGRNGNRINMGVYGNTSEASKSPYCANSLTADLNGDCYVDSADLAEFASQWLGCDIQPQAFCL